MQTGGEIQAPLYSDKNLLMKVRLLDDLELSTGPIRIANGYEKATYKLRDDSNSPKTSKQINSF